MVVRKTKEDRSVRETQPVVLPVKQKESLSYMNSREFTYIYVIERKLKPIFEHRFVHSRVRHLPEKKEKLERNQGGGGGKWLSSSNEISPIYFGQ